MRVFYFSEMAYDPAWDKGKELGSMRVNFPNSHFDPEVGHKLLNRLLDEYRLCDEVGLDIMVNEHHSTATCMTASAPLALAAIARETTRCRLLSLGSPIANRPDPAHQETGKPVAKHLGNGKRAFLNLTKRAAAKHKLRIARDNRINKLIHILREI